MWCLSCCLRGILNILLDLVNHVLVYPEQLHIHELEVKNPIVLPAELTGKFIILDILAVDEAHQQYDAV